MPTLAVITGDNIRELPFRVGSSVREVLEAADVAVRWGCRGNGACGLCTVRIHSGVASAPTGNELLLLSADQIESGVRLACQLTPREDLQIEVMGAPLDPESNPAFLVRSFRSEIGELDRVRVGSLGYGAAVDVGTTNIRVALCDIETGHRLASCVAGNPQSRTGADVMTRLIAAAESTDFAQRMSQVLIDIIRDALTHACDPVDADPRTIVRLRVVGNTPMQLLMTKSDPQTLLDPESWTQPIECRVDDCEGWSRALGIDPHASVEVIQPLAGFVGSDLLAAVLATSLVEGPKSLLIDFGTNSEIALWDGSTLWVTSAAGGPAFESFGLTCGTPAEIGAIFGVRREADSGELHCDVIGDGPATGLCGSGFVDLIAALRDTGELSAIGRLDQRYGEGFVLCAGDRQIRLTDRDVDTLQRAKAAVGAGVATLLGMAHMSQDDLERVCVCGAFGRQMNLQNAKVIGLLPDIPAERFELFDDAAVLGCERLLVDSDGARRLESVRKKAVIVNLAKTPDFDDLFLENLYLRPQGAIET